MDLKPYSHHIHMFLIVVCCPPARLSWLLIVRSKGPSTRWWLGSLTFLWNPNKLRAVGTKTCLRPASSRLPLSLIERYHLILRLASPTTGTGRYYRTCTKQLQRRYYPAKVTETIFVFSLVEKKDGRRQTIFLKKESWFRRNSGECWCQQLIFLYN